MLEMDNQVDHDRAQNFKKSHAVLNFKIQIGDKNVRRSVESDNSIRQTASRIKLALSFFVIFQL